MVKPRALILITLLAACGSRSGALRTTPDADTNHGLVDSGPGGQDSGALDGAREGGAAIDSRAPAVDAFVVTDTRSPAPDTMAQPDLVAVDARPINGDTAPARDTGSPDLQGVWKPVSIDPSLNLGGDIVIYQTKDRAPANAECLDKSAQWLSLAYEFIVEDRKCTADSDCIAVSYGDRCGYVCVFPINKLRTGEFGNHVMKFGNDNCTSCPAGDIPPCTPPRATFCNAGRCEYKN